MYYTYILKLNNSKYYIGYSTDLKARVKTHKDGRVIATRDKLPIQLVFYAAFINKERAVKFEKYLKSSSGFAFRNKRLI